MTYASARSLVAKLLVAALAVAAVLTIAGLVLTRTGAGTGLVHADLRAERWFAGHRTPALNGFTKIASATADSSTVAIVWVVAMIVARRLTRDWIAPLFILVTVGGQKLIYLTVSLIVDRSRPPVATLGPVHTYRSFPSGHTASSVSLYGSIAVLVCVYGAPRVWRVLAIAWAAAAPVCVGFSRMYRGFHYPTDVVAGALLGAVWLAITYHLLLKPLVTARPPRQEGAHALQLA